ncbi:hypothetical protein [Vibrio europaeus]|uniref:hypothetical protein n=1 Tax=Vibrio europaeus TaxID=300876 RepID=UPI00148C2563|nr:hypothetical protein [Vibrio europaeus]NOH26446.1 hypothetical protein [Vibrio europaeus]
MNQNKINPEKLTKPIQLLAAWLVGLLSISSSFLVAASNIEIAWQSGLLVIAAVVNVPLFLSAVFLLQTKFRPELQEDSYYSSYLSNKTNTIVKVTKSDAHFHELNAKIEKLEHSIFAMNERKGSNKDSGLSHLLVGVNKHLPDGDEIKSVLAKHSVQGVTRFGPDDMSVSERVMSISIYLPKDIQALLIALCKEIGMDGYNFFDNAEEQTREDVLIGSYGVLEYEVTN